MNRLPSLILLAAATLLVGDAPVGAEAPAPARASVRGESPAPARAGASDTTKTPGRMKAKPVKLRGEIVDFYCYIEKGATGPGHRDCGLRCVAGDICMGLLTTDGNLYMISQDHMRAMEPAGYRGVPNPFDKCRGLMAWTVDLVGRAMERKGQRIIEIVDVTAVKSPFPEPAPATKGKPAPPGKATAPQKKTAAHATKATPAATAAATPSCDVPESGSR